MAALFEGETLSPLPGHSGLAATRSVDSASLTAALAYAGRCLRGHRPFGVITGSATGLSALVDRLAADYEVREDLHTLRIKSPTDDVQTFLASCLAGLGFELHQASLEDLQNLMTVFLRHESARGRRTVVIIEATEQYGPHVLEFMQKLSRVRAGATPALTFIFTGSPGLHRVLDSRGMAGLSQFTRERFDLDRSLAWVTAPGKAVTVAGPWSGSARVDEAPMIDAASTRNLVVMLDGVIVERRPITPGRLLIGRSPQSGLHLDSPYVSRHHAMLVVAPHRMEVIDLQSTNRTLVNGNIAERQLLEHGDLLSIGNFRVRYECWSSHPSVRKQRPD